VPSHGRFGVQLRFIVAAHAARGEQKGAASLLLFPRDRGIGSPYEFASRNAVKICRAATASVRALRG
jgi:hypothetical protein